MKGNFFGGAMRWRPLRQPSRLGIDWGGILTDVVGGAPDIWRAYQEGEVAEELRKAEEAKAEAARAAAEAERVRAAAEAERAQQEASQETIGGIPRDVVIYGGLGLGVLGLVGLGVALLG